MTFTNRFTGQGLQPAEVSFALIQLEADLQLYWPAFAQKSLQPTADIMHFDAQANGFVVTAPDARQTAPGRAFLVVNIGLYNIEMRGADGLGLGIVSPGQARYMYLTDTSTADGSWKVVEFGIGTANIDLVNAAGPGLLAIGSKLAQAKPVSAVTASRAIASTDRAQVLVWTGGTGTLTLPLSGALAPFNFEVRNQGSGVVTVAATGGEIIDGSASIALNPGESCEVSAGTGAWYTVGRGRSANFNFSQLQKTITGGVVTLSLTEAANVVQTYTGALVSNAEIVVPPIVQVYYASNQTSGAFNLNIRSAAPGGGSVSLPQGQNAVLFCDGTNVINASTTLSGISSLVFSAGTAAATPVGVGATNTGLFSPGAGRLGVSSAGVQVGEFDANGLIVTAAASPRVRVNAPAGSAANELSVIAGQEAGVRLLTGTNLRWQFMKDGAAESGGNAGSDMYLGRYNDAGVLIDKVMTVSRATGLVTFYKGVRDAGSAGEVVQFVGDTSISHPGCVLANGALLSRTAYPDLFAYAQSTGLISEGSWNTGTQGRFSVGDGSTTFRIPDLRAMFMRGTDDGRGLDTGRAWGSYQDQAVSSHSHGVNDGGHAHGVNDPTHAHGVADPSHQHGGSTTGAGAHNHNVTVGNTYIYGGTVCASNVASGAYGTGGVGDHAHGVVTDFRTTGIGIYGNYTGISIQAAGTGISIQAAGAADGHPRNVAYPYFIRY